MKYKSPAGGVSCSVAHIQCHRPSVAQNMSNRRKSGRGMRIGSSRRTCYRRGCSAIEINLRPHEGAHDTEDKFLRLLRRLTSQTASAWRSCSESTLGNNGMDSRRMIALMYPV